MPPAIVRELDLERHGYKVFPQHGYFVPYADGRALQLPDHDPTRRRAADRAVLEGRRRRVRALGRVARRPRRRARPAAHDDPAAVGLAPAARPRRPAPAACGGCADSASQGVGDVTRLFTMSIADLLDEFFEIAADAGRARGERRDRHVGRPALGRDRVRDGAPQDRRRRRRPARLVGVPRRRDGWRQPTRCARAALANGATVRTDAPVARIDVRNGRVRGVTLESGEELRADIVVAATHPQITFLEQIDRAQLPTDFVDRIEQWKTRSGTVKVNVAVDRLPEFTARPGFDPEVHGGTIVLAESLDDIEGAFQDAVAGRAAVASVRRHLHPVGVRSDARARGQARRVDVHAVGAAHVGDRVGPERARRVRRPGDRAGRRGRARLHRLDPAPAGHRAVRDGARVRT